MPGTERNNTHIKKPDAATGALLRAPSSNRPPVFNVFFYLNSQDQKTVRRLQRFTVRLMFGWIAQALIVAPAILFAILAPAPISEFSILVRFLGVIAYTAFQCGTYAWIFIGFAYLLMKRGMSVFAAVRVILSLHQVVMLALLVPLLDLPSVANRSFIEIYLMSLVSLEILSWLLLYAILSIGEVELQTLLIDCDLYIAVLPNKPAPKRDLLQTQLSASVRGPLKHIRAQDKYVEVVTTNGRQLVAMSLTKAESLINQDKGVRVHRSIWIAWPMIDHIFYENGNPRIRTSDGQIFPVSRKLAKTVKLALEERRATAAS